MDNNKIALVYCAGVKNETRLLNILNTLEKNNLLPDLYLANNNAKDFSINGQKPNLKIFHIKYNRFKILSFIKQIIFALRVTLILRKKKYKYIFAVGLEGLFSGFCYKILNKNVVLIYDCKELYIEYFSGFKKTIWGFIQKLSLSKTDYIIHVDKFRLNYFKNIYNIPENKFLLIENFPKRENVTVKIRKPSKTINFIYLGAIMPTRSYPELIDLFSKLPDNYILDLIGPSSPWYLDKMQNCIKSENISIKPPVPSDKISELLENYHIALLFYENTDLNNYYCAPSKVYDYIHNSLPIISYDLPSLKELIETNKIGVCVDKLTVDSFKSAVDTIINKNYFSNYNENIINNYFWEDQEHLLLSIFK